MGTTICNVARKLPAATAEGYYILQFSGEHADEYFSAWRYIWGQHCAKDNLADSEGMIAYKSSVAIVFLSREGFRLTDAADDGSVYCEHYEKVQHDRK